MATEGSSSLSGSDMGRGKAPAPELPPPPLSFYSEDLFELHFKKVLDLAPATAGELRITCNYCDRVYKFKAGEGYGTLVHHLYTKHSDEIINQSEPATSSEGSTGSFPSIFRYSHSRAKKAIAKLICSMSLPFDFAASDSFEETMKHFNPHAKKISRSEIIQEIIELVRESRLVLINDFANLSSNVSICSDVWSDRRKESHFIEISTHWVDETWTLHKRLISHRYISSRHTATNISRKIRTVLKKYGLVGKVFSISFDNDSANTAGLESLVNVCRPCTGARFFYVRRLSNILNACVRDALKTLEDEIDPIRNAISYMFTDSSSTQEWARFCKQNGLPPKYFWIDMPSRWNSTYKLLNDTYQYREVLCAFFVKQQYDIVLSTNQWDVCYNLCQLLKTFKDVIKELSGVYYPTSVLVVDNFVKIAVVFNSLVGCDGLGDCIAEMMVNWLNHFYEIPNVFLIAKLLDPRIRIYGLEEMLGSYYDALFPIKDDKTPIPSVIVDNAKTCLFNIFHEYRIKYSDSLGINTYSSSSNPYQELEAYLTADFELIETESFDILKWWSRWTMNFPIVSLIAKDVLAVPASIASVEQAFSEEGYILKDREYELTPPIREKKRLLGDWANAELQQQEMDTDEADESDTIETESDTDSFDDF